MARKLKNLKVKKVDFVNEGANPDAKIYLTKKKENMVQKLLSILGLKEIESAIEEINKGESEGFGEKYSEVKNGKIAEEIWDVCFALQSSLWSILDDAALDSVSTETAMRKSLEDFSEVVKDCITNWSNRKLANVSKRETTETEMRIIKSAFERLNIAIPEEKVNTEILKGEEENMKEEMKIDKSKLTDAERAFLESIEKRFMDEDAKKEEVIPEGESSITKSATETQKEEDIYKGVHPAVREELEALKKFREQAEDKELHAVAKKYEIIGKKPEELVPVLKSLKAAGGSAYNDMISTLDHTVEMVEKSGIFSEIGKSGKNTGEGPVKVKIDNIAKSMMEKDPGLTYSNAVAKAWEQNPELLAEYDEQEGF